MHAPTHCLSALGNWHCGDLYGTCVMGPTSATAYGATGLGMLRTLSEARNGGPVTFVAALGRKVPRYLSYGTAAEHVSVIVSRHLE